MFWVLFPTLLFVHTALLVLTAHRLQSIVVCLFPHGHEHCLCLWGYKHRNSHQTSFLWVTTHCSILLCVCVHVCSRARVCVSLLPIHKPFCVGVCQQCCLQAGPHCVELLLLIDTGPLALRVPMAPQPQADGRLKPEPWIWEEFVCTTLSLPWWSQCYCRLDIKNLRWKDRYSCGHSCSS